MNKTMLPTGLCLLLTAATLHGMGPVKATPGIGPDACWSPDATIMEKIRGECAPLSGNAFESRFVAGMSEEGFSDPSAPIEVGKGQTFVLTLRSNPTTGYIWQPAEPFDERVLRFIGHEYRSDHPGLTGAGGREIWTFKAVGTGETRIMLKYVRPWEKNAAPAKTARFTVLSGGEMKKQSVEH